MKQRNINSGYGYVLRLERGESLREKLNDLTETEGIQAAFFFGIGAVESAKVGSYDLGNKKYLEQSYSDIFELTSLQGNISIYEGKPNIHMHVVLSKVGDNRHIVSGHLNDARVAVTVEIFVHLLQDVKMTRKMNDEVGLPLLEFE